MELLNALRRDGLLAATAAGWRWDDAAVRAHLGRSEVAGLLAARVEALPATVAAGAGGDGVSGRAGRAEPAADRHRRRRPAWWSRRWRPRSSEGLLVAEPGAREAVRFRHDRIREAVLAGLDPPRRRALQLAMARRLAEVPELFAVAAEQYLPVADAVDDAAERAAGGGAAAARRRPGGVDRRVRAGERAAGGRAAADRPGARPPR